MARPPAARAKVLDAYISILCGESERAATMEATAAKAGVSKGGLLYHFASKEALAEAVIQKCEELVVEDLERMKSAPEGPASYFVRTSAEVDTQLDRLMVAVRRLMLAGVEAARVQFENTYERWLAVLVDDLGDPDTAHLVLLAGEGLYTFSASPGTWYQRHFESTLPRLLELVPQLKKLGNINE